MLNVYLGTMYVVSFGGHLGSWPEIIPNNPTSVSLFQTRNSPLATADQTYIASLFFYFSRVAIIYFRTFCIYLQVLHIYHVTFLQRKLQPLNVEKKRKRELWTGWYIQRKVQLNANDVDNYYCVWIPETTWYALIAANLLANYTPERSAGKSQNLWVLFSTEFAKPRSFRFVAFFLWYQYIDAKKRFVWRRNWTHVWSADQIFFNVVQRAWRKRVRWRTWSKKSFSTHTMQPNVLGVAFSKCLVKYISVDLRAVLSCFFEVVFKKQWRDRDGVRQSLIRCVCRFVTYFCDDGASHILWPARLSYPGKVNINKIDASQGYDGGLFRSTVNLRNWL